MNQVSPKAPDSMESCLECLQLNPSAESHRINTSAHMTQTKQEEKQQQLNEQIPENNSEEPQEQIKNNQEHKEENVVIQRRKCTAKRVLFIILFIAIFVGIIVLYILYSPLIIKELEFFFKWVQDHPDMGVISYMGLFFVALLVMIPQSWFIFAGAICFRESFGLVEGSFICWACASVVLTLATSLTFCFSRKCCKKCTRKCFINKFKITKAIDNGLKSDGVKITILLRISPVVPSNVLNYLLGTTQITFVKYFLGSLMQCVMAGFGVYLASSLNDISDIIRGDYQGSTEYLAYIIIGVILSVILVVIVILIARRQLRKILKRQQADPPQQEQNQA